MSAEKDEKTPLPTAEDIQFVKCVSLSAKKGVLRKFTLSVANQSNISPRQTAHLAVLRGKTVLTFERRESDGKVSHNHISIESIMEELPCLLTSYQRANLSTSLGDCELLRSKKGKVTLRGLKEWERAMDTAPTEQKEDLILPFNREVKHYFDGTAPFLQYLGVSDKNGRVYDKKQSKFRQINRFIEHLADVYPKLPKEGVLTVYDLCCGKSYLSFAVYAYLHDVMKREVDMLCMDLKEDVIAYCGETARNLHFSGMRFAAGDIRTLEAQNKPHLVVSLHACDIATDIVLETAIRLGADVILSTPCCHRYISRRFDSPALAFIYRHPHLASRLGETVTDALRLLYLRANGYKAEAVELIDLSDTPKNTLLRCVKIKGFDPNSKKAKADAQEYKDTLAFLLGNGSEEYLKDIGI